MKQVRTHLWYWGWLFTLPVSVVFLYWLWATFDQYIDFGVRYRPSYAPTMTLRETGKREFGHIIREIELAFRSIYVGRFEKQTLKKVYIFVSENKLDELNARLPSSGYHYVKGRIINNGNVEKIKLRYRGDFPDHWANYKKSFRVKTKKDELYEGMRKFNLIVPDIDGGLNNYLGYKLAEKLGLITPKSEMVELVINGKLHGLYLKVEQLEELTLRRHGRMPGDLYAGELVASDGYLGSNNYLTDHPGFWKKVSINNHYDEPSIVPLSKFMALVNAKPDKVNQERLTELLDIDAWGAFLAFTTLSQTFHYDEYHNWRLYFDPAIGKFIPVIWDPDAWSWHNLTNEKARLDIIVSPIYEALYQNTEILRARNRVLRKFFISGNAERFIKSIDDIIKRSQSVVYRDPNLPDSSPENLLHRMHRLSSIVSRTFNSVHQALDNEVGSVSYMPLRDKKIALNISGLNDVKSITLQYQLKLSTSPKAYINYLKGGKYVRTDVSGSISYSGGKLKLDIPLSARYELEYFSGNDVLSRDGLDRKLVKFYNLGRLIRRTVKIEPAYYELEIRGIDEENKLLDVIAELDGGEKTIVKLRDNIEQSSFGDSYPIVRPNPVRNIVRWSGVVNIEGIKDIYNPVYIEKGTKIYMGEDAMLRFYSRVNMNGTEDKPVIVLPAPGNKRAWGTIVLQGHGSNGSSIRYSIFEGGSGVKRDLYEYSGMLSIHNVSGVSISHSIFRNNAIVDDMVHAVYSDISIDESTFENALSDALDLDISRARITKTKFYNSGNDAIDLMTSKVVVKDNLIKGSGDKAVSVGEGSFLLAINDVLSDNSIGIQSKDGSVATIVNSTLVNNNRSIDAYKKNWRYGSGGNIFVYKSRVDGERVTTTADTKSNVFFIDSYVHDLVDLKKSSNRRLQFDVLSDSVSPQYTKEDVVVRMGKELKLNGEFGRQYWDYADPSRRGALLDVK